MYKNLFNFMKTFFPKKYDLSTLEGIQSIQIPKYNKLTSISSPINNIEYILQRKATEYKKQKQMDLAIACLRKSNEIMPYSNFQYSKHDYLRLVEFLKDNGQFAEAKKEEEIINKTIPDVDNLSLMVWKMTLNECKNLKTDLVEMSSHESCCGECAKYQGRVYSLSGKSKLFPKIPDIIFKSGSLHEGCRHTFYPYIYGTSPAQDKKMFKISNKPFIDNRTKAEKAIYEKNLGKQLQKEQDKKEFDLLREFLPELAPKSFSGYRKMKNLKSANYEKLLKIAKEKAIF